MAITGSGIQGVVGSIGTAVGDFMSADASKTEAAGDFKSAQSYLKAKGISLENEQISQESTALQMYQEGFKERQATSKAEATIAGNGLQGGNTADILKMSHRQGALASAAIGEQGAINKNAFAQQAESYQGMSDAASAAGNAALKASEAKSSGGFFSLIGGGIGLASMFMGI